MLCIHFVNFIVNSVACKFWGLQVFLITHFEFPFTSKYLSECLCKFANLYNVLIRLKAFNDYVVFCSRTTRLHFSSMKS